MRREPERDPPRDPPAFRRDASRPSARSTERAIAARRRPNFQPARCGADAILPPSLPPVVSPAHASSVSIPPPRARRLFYSYFKTLVGKTVTVELKNDLAISGKLVSVDQYLNIKLENTAVVDEERYPHMKSVRNCFVRGSVVRYVQLPADAVDVDILHDATRREARGS